jgi:hypothetical protein
VCAVIKETHRIFFGCGADHDENTGWLMRQVLVAGFLSKDILWHCEITKGRIRFY